MQAPIQIQVHQEPPPPPVIALRLKSWIDDAGDFRLSAVREDGQFFPGCHVLHIGCRDGLLYLHNDCRAPGISRDEEGSIEVVK